MTTEKDNIEAEAPALSPSAEGAVPQQRIEPRALLQSLQKAFPAFRDCKPLALKIDASIVERMPGIDRKSLRAALRMYTASTRYLKAVERSQQRFDLDGQPVGEVTDEQRTHASTTLKERFAAIAKQQKEKREAEAAEKRRTEKLQQLVSKFGR
ncbi:ProQ/FINO family protein [Thauera linaloolentis]|uniref:ProQ activator of osmoprotectant transporter ProP n=1 Tax=Thauera linaloolentis (strain DSM 12138 / JCM 21573 / CCUG 41526 / CIP 105981 / IAM 15112 / NBRC 102519 / 47Lol) TaxID=1123367 RepID=N6ZCW7_THAL4|nr:ProQ/FinO family protein [Thauera linaloolentis]ENO90034.1 ProQ activator of osmoprotectant transporter ProP [Thauera linaloolentis 47Lol = DSM 12138]MCM8565317.1 ProQ/FinO family protein [Thauera linaloolentis]